MVAQVSQNHCPNSNVGANQLVATYAGYVSSIVNNRCKTLPYRHLEKTVDVGWVNLSQPALDNSIAEELR